MRGVLTWFMHVWLGEVALCVALIGSGMACTQPAACAETRVFAYRGGRAVAPENTEAAVVRAVGARADGIELDMRVTADGVLVAFHDASTGRTSDDPSDREVEGLTFAELSELDVGAWFDPAFAGERVPTAAHLVELIPADTEIVFDLKTDAAVEPVAALIEAQGLQPRAYVSSFEIERLAAFHERLPEVKIGFCLRELSDMELASTTEVDFIRLPGNIERFPSAQEEVLRTQYGLVVTDAATTPYAAMVVASDVAHARVELTSLRAASCER